MSMNISELAARLSKAVADRTAIAKLPTSSPSSTSRPATGSSMCCAP
jgi:hypothetical protein